MASLYLGGVSVRLVDLDRVKIRVETIVQTNKKEGEDESHVVISFKGCDKRVI